MLKSWHLPAHAHTCVGVVHRLRIPPALPRAVQRLPKLSSAYLNFLHVAFRSHIQNLVMLPTASFMQLIQTLTTALDALDTDVSSQAAIALDSFATFFVRNAKKDTPVMTSLRMHLSTQPAIFEALMKIVFQVVVFGELGNQWSLCRPLLSLILAAETVRPGVRPFPTKRTC